MKTLLTMAALGLLLGSAGGARAGARAGNAIPQAQLPKIKSSKTVGYPEAARQVGLEGRVLMAFDIAVNGKASNAAVIFADEDALDPAAIELLSGLLFEIPNDWENSGNRLKRYHLGIVFCIPPSGQIETFADVTSPILVMTARIAGSPVRHPPGRPASGRCATTPKL